MTQMMKIKNINKKINYSGDEVDTILKRRAMTQMMKL